MRKEADMTKAQKVARAFVVAWGGIAVSVLLVYGMTLAIQAIAAAAAADVASR